MESSREKASKQLILSLEHIIASTELLHITVTIIIWVTFITTPSSIYMAAVLLTSQRFFVYVVTSHTKIRMYCTHHTVEHTITFKPGNTSCIQTQPVVTYLWCSEVPFQSVHQPRSTHPSLSYVIQAATLQC